MPMKRRARATFLLLLMGCLPFAVSMAADDCEDDCPPQCGSCAACPLLADLPTLPAIATPIGTGESHLAAEQILPLAPARAPDHVPLTLLA
jgi:hypothetical protein